MWARVVAERHAPPPRPCPLAQSAYALGLGARMSMRLHLRVRLSVTVSAIAALCIRPAPQLQLPLLSRSASLARAPLDCALSQLGPKLAARPDSLLLRGGGGGGGSARRREAMAERSRRVVRARGSRGHSGRGWRRGLTVHGGGATDAHSTRARHAGRAHGRARKTGQRQGRERARGRGARPSLPGRPPDDTDTHLHSPGTRRRGPAALGLGAWAPGAQQSCCSGRAVVALTCAGAGSRGRGGRP